MFCPWAYSSSLAQLYPLYLAQILGYVVTCGAVKTMSLCHGWDWQPPQTAFCIQIRHKKYLSSFICCPWAYSSSLAQLYPLYLQILGYVVTCGVNMMSSHHWGWQPPQTAFCIQIRHTNSIRAHWYAVHGHTIAALQSNTHTTWLRLWGTW